LIFRKKKKKGQWAVPAVPFSLPVITFAFLLEIPMYRSFYNNFISAVLPFQLVGLILPSIKFFSP